MTTTKVIEFTKDQKSLIWQTKLNASNATEAEAKAFFEVCENFGLNPLEGDIIFQKFETKYGPRVSYIVSRDGRYKNALRDPNFLNLSSFVVHKGDHFEVDVMEGVPKHTFGAERGEKIGAWAVVKHKVRGNIMTYVDFQEYFKAFSSKNAVWRDLPSAMIKKVAEVEALKMAFPLGVTFRSEFESEIIDLNEDMKDVKTEEAGKKDEQNPLLMSDEEFEKEAAAYKEKSEQLPKTADKAETPNEDSTEGKQKRKRRTKAEIEADKLAEEAAKKAAEEAAAKEVKVKEKTLIEAETNEEAQSDLPAEEPTNTVIKEVADPENKEKSEDNAQEEINDRPEQNVEVEDRYNEESIDLPQHQEIDTSVSEEIATDTSSDHSSVDVVKETPDQPIFEFIRAENGESPGGMNILKVQYRDQTSNIEVGIAAGEEQIQKFDEFEDNVAGQFFTAHFQEQNGFTFITDASKVG